MVRIRGKTPFASAKMMSVMAENSKEIGNGARCTAGHGTGTEKIGCHGSSVSMNMDVCR